MNNVLTTPIGIDKYIQNIQVDLYEQLALVWTGDIDGYGRIEKTPSYTKGEPPRYYQTAKIVFPEWFNSVKKEYEEVFYDDSKSCIFCFLKDDTYTTKDEYVYNCDVKIVFMLNIEKIYPNSTERALSKAHAQAIEILQKFSFRNFKIKGVVQRLEYVFKEYDTNNVRFDDMHPLHCFGVEIDLEFYMKSSNC